MLIMLWKMLCILIRSYCAMVGGIWTTMELLHTLFPQNALVGYFYNSFLLYLFVPLVIAIGLLIYKIRLKEKIGTKTIKIRYGNILNCKKGSIVLGINNEGRSESSIINHDSIHGQLIEKYGEKKVKDAIENSNDMIIAFKPTKEKDFLLLKMSSINEHQIAEANNEQVEQAIHDLFWQQKKYNVINNTLYIPLLGTGTAGISSSREVLLQTIIKEFISFEKNKMGQRDVISHLVIVIWWKDIDYVPPTRVAELLRHHSKYCSECKRLEL